MNSPELIIIGINLAILLAAYFYFYPRFAGSNVTKLAVYDFAITIIVLLIAACLYWETGTQFNMVILSVNWFWFALLTYAALEIPLNLWYRKKNNIWA